jgi:hypothetical protein
LTTAEFLTSKRAEIEATPLTEDEIKEALFERKKVKFFKEKSREYWSKYKSLNEPIK